VKGFVTVYLEGGIKPGYTYGTHIPNLKVGDTVIVEAPRAQDGSPVEHSGLAYPGTVVDADPPETMCKRATKWIVDRVDWDAHRARSALAPFVKEDNNG
jgi:hypothetical protein